MEKPSDLQVVRDQEPPRKGVGGANRRRADGANNGRHGLVFVSIGGLDAPKQSINE